MTVYIVTSGEYSDYGIRDVFTSREQAELYISTMPDLDYEEYFVEEYETDRVKLEGKVYYGLRFCVNDDYIFKWISKVFVSKNPVEETVYYTGHRTVVTIPVNRFYCRFDYDDSKECEKIAQDWIAQYKYRKEVDEK